MQAQTAQYLDIEHLYYMSLYLFSGSDYQMTHFADKLNLNKVLLKICLYTAWQKEILHLLTLLGVIFTLLCLMIHMQAVWALKCVYGPLRALQGCRSTCL